MSEIVVASTTDALEDVQAAAGANPGETEEQTEGAAEDEQPESDPDADPEEDKQEPQPRRKRGGFQRRIDELTRDKYELQSRVRALEERLAQPSMGPAGPADSEGRPRPEDFDSYEAWVDALAGWKVEERERKRQAEEAQARALAEQQAKAAEWAERMKTARQSIRDFDDVMEAADVAISPAVEQVLLESEKGPELAYWLAKHPDDAERISRMSAIAAARELGKIEARIATPADKKPAARPTSAPPPITPVGGKPTSSGKDPSEMTLAEYRAWREQGGGR